MTRLIELQINSDGVKKNNNKQTMNGPMQHVFIRRFQISNTNNITTYIVIVFCLRATRDVHTVLLLRS